MSNSVKLKETHEGREAIGLQDGGHVILKCNGCNKPLVDVWRVRPNEKDPATGKHFEWKLQAECCYCGKTSFVTTVLGGFYTGGYGVVDRKTGEDVELTAIVDRVPHPDKPGVLLIKTVKVK